WDWGPPYLWGARRGAGSSPQVWGRSTPASSGTRTGTTWLRLSSPCPVVGRSGEPVPHFGGVPLALLGGVALTLMPPPLRFEGQEHWIRPETRWRPEVLRLRDVPVVALDLSGSPLTYDGLDNLVPLTRLQHLDLSGCPHLDDWALGRLHVFGNSLRELSVARCPHVTERGLATLHHLQELQRLDVAGVRVPSPGLVRILLEEMLPGCQILGMDLGDIPPEGANPLSRRLIPPSRR
uniref:Distal membrane arm assembly complex 2-like protein n=1 Tax=Accipiter nisus TaxID=211598 RepID=A0A8B9MUA2_9AVES